ncbi:putative c2 domain-containing protein [Phaeomoniella chlamydospora]|uniref:Putative c2 domain-containing protein n=1 Tax=Phaeomoniella chlamydospora TaxID=158046 RepID=A0A0G2EYQ6_PHACM|nr:putative c2 domain-containing protein [Phaeomoniella chlamydospora]
MRDFSLVRDSKSTRLPHGFVGALEKRLTGLLVGREGRPEYKDALVKRTFAAFFNAFTEQTFKKRMEKDRRAEDLVLIFFSNATKELQKGKPPGDDGVKLMVDRHVALFVRLISIILKDHDWARDRPDLTARLATLESKLLVHDQDLVENGTGGTQIEVVAPLSYEVKDMPLVQVVGRIFGLTNTQIQSDIDSNKSVWTEKAALQDLKLYQTHLNLPTHKTLSADDFDLDDAYDIWKKAEAPDLSQMMLAIVQANPELAKTTTGTFLPQFNAQSGTPMSPSSDSPSATRKMSWKSEDVSSYVIDQPVDISNLNLSENASEPTNEESIFTYIPPDPRSFYHFVLGQALTHDLKDATLEPSQPTGDMPAVKLLSKQSTELLNELALRWRLPNFSRIVLFLDVIKDKFADQEIPLDTLDAAFNYVKEPVTENKRSSVVLNSALFDRKRWTVMDVALMQRLLSDLHEALLRELYGAMMHCYDNKPSPMLSSVLYVLEHHVEGDPNFIYRAENLARFRDLAIDGLREKAREKYGSFVDKSIPQDQGTWEFFHVVELGKAVILQSDKIQKRYKKNPEIKGVNALMVFLETTLPAFAEDAKELINRILQDARERGEEVPIQDGFDLYKELVHIRSLHASALPNTPFAFHVEDLLADFVWRWIAVTSEQIPTWVEEAIKQDNFQVRTETPGQVPTEEERHSTSVIDIFRSFNQIIDQVAQLNWDDDLGYAKFMTALSKSIGAGLARYCELIEQRFAREMDRLTPEQEAAMNQTRQEKWMQLAKDAWNNKERVEPFQFLPESFVKLNNIAFAIQHWDKLEHEVNVDACAEVLQRYAPPVTSRSKKNQSYVFSIKIVEAEDLKPCDMNGLSDPYVVLTDEYQKRLSKTRIVYGNLNPRWDDAVDITTTGALNIIATIWDWDALGDHDYVGRTSLKLDPSHFGDFLPREYWLDLDTQGRLLLRVSMEGERDDIQFYFGKAFRALKRTERDMTRKITDKLSAYINHCLSRRALKQLLSRGLSMSTVSNYFNRNRMSMASAATALSDADVLNALKPLFTYFDDNFAIMNQTLTSEAMIMVMTRLWKEVLMTIESLLVPPLSDKPSQQRPLTQQELDTVFKWLALLFDFFHAVDEETGEANGVPINVLKSPKYHEIQTLNFFYFETTENLIRTSERMASATLARQQATRARLSAPASFGAGPAGLIGMANTSRRAKSIMLSRNLGTMRKAKEEKWQEAQADPNDDMVLRILRMRPEAAGYLRDRSRQKERLAAAAAAEVIVRQSLMAGGGRMTGATGGGLVRRKERAFVFGVYIQESNDAHMNDGHQVFTLLIA